MFDFTDNIFVVTGAAGNLGQAVVKAFLSKGGIVCALDHRKGRLEAVFNLKQPPGKLLIFEEVDVLNRNALKLLSDKIRDQAGGVDGVVHTVGGFNYGDQVYELSPETWQKMIDLNVISFLNTAAAFVPGMVERKSGKVITIGSKAALQGSAKTGAYGAAKGALLRLTESMAEELKGHHIQVNCVLPSTIDTPENRQAMPKSDFTKWVKPEKIAEVILFLSSPASDAVNGAALPVYG